MRELSLFTGAGGGLLGTKLLGWEHIGYVEWNEYCQQVIAARIRDGYLPIAPIFTDVREFVQSGAAEQYRGIAQVVSAGFPCQPFSIAGKQAGADDERNMWPATADVIRIVQPQSVLLENVPGLISAGYLGVVIGDLAEMGYVGRWGVIGAADCGAPHKRDRLWIVAHANNGPGCAEQKQQQNSGAKVFRGGREARFSHMAYSESKGCATGRVGSVAQGDREVFDMLSANSGDDMADPNSIGSQRSWWAFDPGSPAPSDDREVNRAFYESRWGVESQLGRVANGVANRVERLRAIGNGQSSPVVRRAWECLA